jgi:hypothetical protein
MGPGPLILQSRRISPPMTAVQQHSPRGQHAPALAVEAAPIHERGFLA